MTLTNAARIGAVALGGLVVGFLAAIWAFAIDADIMSIPYGASSAEAVVDVTLTSPGRPNVVLPQGTRVRVLRESPEGLVVYQMHFAATSSWRDALRPLDEAPETIYGIEGDESAEDATP